MFFFFGLSSVSLYSVWCLVLGVYLSRANSCHANMVLFKKTVPEGRVVWRGRQGEMSLSSISLVSVQHKTCWLTSCSKHPDIAIMGRGLKDQGRLVLWTEEIWKVLPINTSHTTDFFHHMIVCVFVWSNVYTSNVPQLTQKAHQVYLKHFCKYCICLFLLLPSIFCDDCGYTQT